jgi:hypothetical protein
MEMHGRDRKDAIHFLEIIIKLLDKNQSADEPKASPSELPENPRIAIPPISLSKPSIVPIKISELDIVIEAERAYQYKFQIYDPKMNGGKSLNWNCAACVYASMRLAAVKGKMAINTFAWNTIVHGMVIRMIVNEKEQVVVGSQRFKEQEAIAYQDIEQIDIKVDEAMQNKGPYMFEPLVDFLAAMAGCSSNPEAKKALSASIGLNAEHAYSKIIPELLHQLI